MKNVNKIVKRFMSLLMASAFLILQVPIVNFKNVVDADDSVKFEIPVKMFAKASDLMDPTKFTLSESGDRKVGKIQFGTRPDDVEYLGEKHADDLRTAKSGPITWLIAGKDTDDITNERNIVLFSEEPLMSCNKYDAKSNSLFYAYTFTGEEEYSKEPGTDYGDQKIPSQVYSNHWGASNLRKELKGLETNENYFSTAQQALMLNSTISTEDLKNQSNESNIVYNTTDKLYAPSYVNNEIWVGNSDSLKIHINNAGKGRYWLRSPTNSKLSAWSVGVAPFEPCVVYYQHPAPTAAFKMDLSSVIFASAASAASSVEGGKFSEISGTPAMNMRFSGNAELDTVKLTKTATSVSYPAVTGGNLMVCAQGKDGKTYQMKQSTDSAGDLIFANAELPNDVTVAACEAWIEKEEDGLVYASAPAAALAAFDKTDPATGVRVYAAPGILQLDGELAITPIPIATVLSRISQDLQNSINGNNIDVYDVKVVDPETGKTLSSATGENFTVYIPVSEEFLESIEKLENLKSLYFGQNFETEIQRGEESFEIIDGKVYSFNDTNHFSLYGVADQREADSISSFLPKTGDSTPPLINLLIYPIILFVLYIFIKKKEEENSYEKQ